MGEPSRSESSRVGPNKFSYRADRFVQRADRTFAEKHFRSNKFYSFWYENLILIKNNKKLNIPIYFQFLLRIYSFIILVVKITIRQFLV